MMPHAEVPESGTPSSTSANPSPRTDHVLAIKDAILAAGDLPTLPLIALEISRLAENPLTSATDMMRLIRSDPSLTARILRVANSTYYGMPRRIESLNTALAVLGMREISTLVTSISVVKTFPGRDGEDSLDMQSFWEHSAGCAEIARILASRLHLHFHGAEFTAGLLHDVGKIVLDQYFHAEFLSAREIERGGQVSSVFAERTVMGVDHAEIGAWLAETWSLPLTIAEAIRYHHEPHLANQNGLLTGVIHIADMISKAIMDEARRDQWNQQLISDRVWDLLAERDPEIGRLDVASFTRDLEENIQRAQEMTRTVYI